MCRELCEPHSAVPTSSSGGVTTTHLQGNVRPKDTGLGCALQLENVRRLHAVLGAQPAGVGRVRTAREVLGESAVGGPGRAAPGALLLGLGKGPTVAQKQGLLSLGGVRGRRDG